MFHPELRTLVVLAKSVDRDYMWPAAWAVPWLSWASEIKGGTRGRRQVAIMAKHWGILRPLGLPSPPVSYPLPPLLAKTSIGPCSDDEDENEGSDG